MLGRAGVLGQPDGAAKPVAAATAAAVASHSRHTPQLLLRRWRRRLLPLRCKPKPCRRCFAAAAAATAAA